MSPWAGNSPAGQPSTAQLSTSSKALWRSRTASSPSAKGAHACGLCWAVVPIPHFSMISLSQTCFQLPHTCQCPSTHSCAQAAGSQGCCSPVQGCRRPPASKYAGDLPLLRCAYHARFHFFLNLGPQGTSQLVARSGTATKHGRSLPDTWHTMCRYAWEISTVEGGWGLHDVLASRKPTLDGIVNGIDLVEWNPASDKHTPAKFSADDLSGGGLCWHACVRPRTWREPAGGAGARYREGLGMVAGSGPCLQGIVCCPSGCLRAAPYSLQADSRDSCAGDWPVSLLEVSAAAGVLRTYTAARVRLPALAAQVPIACA